MTRVEKYRYGDNGPLNNQNALIVRLHRAVKMSHIQEPFTAPDVEHWMIAHHIIKEDGTKYKDGYPANLLYNSLIKEKQTKNRNSKWLRRRRNADGVYEYWFAD